MSEPYWELLGQVIPVQIDYVGNWVAGTAYQPGQVVRYNGVDYLAVNPSTGQTPPALSTNPADSGWTTMALAGGTHYGAPYGPCRYRRLSNGIVICDGLFTPTVVSQTAFTFPVGYRPSYSPVDLIFHTACSVSPSPGETWRVDGNGSLRVQAGVPVGGWVTMSGIQFYVG